MSLLLLPGVIWLFVNATVNRHSHIAPDGYLFYHAHPYDKSPSDPLRTDSHDHSEKELILLSFISNPAAPFVLFLALTTILTAIPRLSGILPGHVEHAREYYQVHHYHAPPGF